MKKFSELTKQQQKIRIVKDAIKQINTGTIKPKTEDYFDMKGVPYGWIAKEKQDLQTLLKKGQKCTACAKGSLFVACVFNTNKVSTLDSLDNESFQKDKLKKWFPVLELDMIETAFENEVICDDVNQLEKYGEKTLLGESCITFGRKYKPAKSRLLAILNNILKNGKFTP